MWEFIVLGEIPGTSLKLSFETWLLTMAILSVGAVYFYRNGLHRFVLLGVIGLGLWARRSAARLYAYWLELRSSDNTVTPATAE